MKIHRQPPEDWSERRLHPQLLTHRLNSLAPNLGGSGALLQPQASPRAYSFQGITLPSNNNSNNSHTDSVLNSFEVNNDHSSGGSGVAHASDMGIRNGISTLSAFSNMSETNPHDVLGGGVSDSAANQRGPPNVRSPVHSPWTQWMG